MVWRISDIKTIGSIQVYRLPRDKSLKAQEHFLCRGSCYKNASVGGECTGTVLTGTRAASCCSKMQGKRITQLYGSIRCLDQRSSEAEVTVSLLEALCLKQYVQTVTVGNLVAPVYPHITMLCVFFIGVREILMCL
jgi:hypothetical protein